MARSSEKNEQLRQRSKEKICAAALNQFAKKGLFATRIQDIALEAQISQGLLYRHYATKDEIFVELIIDALEMMSTASLELLAMPLSGKEKIVKAIEAMIHTIENSERYRLTSRLISEAMLSEAIPQAAKEVVLEKRDQPYQIFKQIIEQGQQEGDVVEGDSYELAILFWSTINGLTLFRHTRDSSYPLPNTKILTKLLLKEGESIT